MGGFATYDKGGGISGTTVYADNVDFTGTGRTNTIKTNGQLLIGATTANAGGNHINVGLITSPLGTLTVGYSAPNITLDVAGGSAAIEHLTGNTGGQLNPDGSNNFNLLGNNTALNGFASWITGSGSTLTHNSFSPAKWYVNPTVGIGTHTTITSALTSASSGDTIFITPGTYTENPTLKAGVNLTAFGSDSSLNQTGKVIINGTCTLTTAGTVTISGIQLQTNSAALLAVTGSAASIVNLVNCNLNCTNTTGISFTSSNALSAINLYDCTGDLGTTGIGFYSMSSIGTMSIIGSTITNSGASLTVSAMTGAGGLTRIETSKFNSQFTTASVASMQVVNSYFQCSPINSTPFSLSGTGGSNIVGCYIDGGVATAVISGTGNTVTMSLCTINSSNTNAISGSGTLIYSGLSFLGSSTVSINTTTQIGGLLKGGVTQAPSAGFIGEQIRATVAPGSAVSLTTNTAATVTSINLTAGIWDVSCIGVFTGSGTATQVLTNISTTTNTITGSQGDNIVQNPTGGVATADVYLTIPSYRVTLSSSASYFLVARAIFAAGAVTSYGRISATRVG